MFKSIYHIGTLMSLASLGIFGVFSELAPGHEENLLQFILIKAGGGALIYLAHRLYQRWLKHDKLLRVIDNLANVGEEKDELYF